MAYIESPRTDAGNATFMTNRHDLDDFSVENSMLSPIKHRDDIVSMMRNERGASLKTPRGRAPLAERKNLPAASRGVEFTPLLHSVTKKNLERKGKSGAAPETPAFLKASYRGSNSPALPGGESSAVYGSDCGSSVLGDNADTPIPQAASSSVQSTPLAVLPKRDATGVLSDQGNIMTLREQENIIDKIEKENFGLKLKIHFLEDSLKRAGPGFNEAALQENTELKVDRITMHKELARCKKTLSQAERDIEAYRRHLEDVQAKAKKHHADESLRQELEDLKKALVIKKEEGEDFRKKAEAADRENVELQKLKVDVEDLEADLREKDRLVDERDNELDRVKSQAKKDLDELDEVYAELEGEKQRVEELENVQQAVADQTEKLRKAQEEVQDALAAQRKAESDLEELQDEMSNKSFTTKGLSRQLEEKANKLQDDLTDLREKHSELRVSFEDKSRQVKRLSEVLQDHDQDADVRNQRLQDKHDLLRHDHESTVRRCESLNDQLKQAVKNLQSKSEEKDLLHSRHDALSTESQILQRDLSKAHSKIQELEDNLQTEKQHAEDNDRQLRAEAKNDVDRLSGEVSRLQRELEDEQSRLVTGSNIWESQRRGLQSQREKAEEQAAGLQRTIAKLQEVEGTLSGKELKLQQALESEKQRHQSEEAVLGRQIQHLNADVDEKRQELEELRSDLSQAKEKLRVSDREQGDLEDKVQSLEDEVEVLQSELDREADDNDRERLETAEIEAETLRAQLIDAQQKLEAFETSRIKESYSQQDQLNSKLRHTEELLNKIKTEKQSLQESLATNDLEMRQLQASSAKIEAERNEKRSQLEQLRNQVEETLNLDQEKLDLKTTNLRLDSEVSRLREERKSLLERNALFERELADEISKATLQESRLNDEIAGLQQKLSLVSGSCDRDVNIANKKTQRLENRLKELEDLLASSKHCDEDAAADLSMVRKDLSAARKKETEHAEREAAQKELLRDLKHKVSRLEQQTFEAETAKLNIDSPKSSIAGSARKSEIVELQRRLTDAHQQLKDVRAKSREDLRVLQRRLADAEKQIQDNLSMYEQQREQLEVDVSAASHEQESLQSKNIAANQTITRLQTRISLLEQDLHNRRRSATADSTIAEERADLHEMLKDAKLQAEDLQVQIEARETSLTTATNKEKDLRTQLRRVREERNLQTQKAEALSAELDNLQNRYERAVDNFSRQQRRWEEERKAMVSRVRFPNMSVSSLHANEDNEKLEKRHASELKGLAKQIQWLRAKCRREEGFRTGLVYEKKFLTLQIEMFEACNKIDLQLLQEMGISSKTDPKPSTRLRLGDALRSRASDKRHQRPSLKAVGFVVMAGCRMRKMADEWQAQKKIRDALGRKLEGMAGGKGRKISTDGRRY